MVIRRCVTTRSFRNIAHDSSSDLQSLLTETNGDVQLASTRIIEGMPFLLSPRVLVADVHRDTT